MLEPVDKDRKFDASQVVEQLPPLSREYRVQPGDFLEFRIFTNNGESILDPNGELRFGSPGAGGQGGTATPTMSRGAGGAGGAAAGAGGAAGAGRAASQGAASNNSSQFEVLPNGQVRLPMVGSVPVVGLRLPQIDSVLERKFSVFYKEVFVECRIGNQRVVVLGAVTNGSQVIPLTYQATSLLEVLAMAGGLAPEARATNIRLVRGQDPRTAQVQLVDLSTPAGMRKANVLVIANDVVYIEPVRRPILNALTDNLRFVTILVSLALVASVVVRFLP